MKKILLLFIAISTSLLSANEALKEFKFVRGASCRSTPGNYSAITLDREFYRHLNNDYYDLTVINAKGEQIPFAIRDLKEKRTFLQENIRNSKITAFKVDKKENRAYLTLTLDTPDTINAVRFDTDIMRFDKKISVTFYDADKKIIRKDSNLALYQYDKIFGEPLLRFGNVKAAAMDIVIDNFSETEKSRYTTETVSSDKRSTTHNISDIEFRFKKITPLELKNIESWSGAFPLEIELEEISRVNAYGKTTVTIDAARVPLTEITVNADDRFYDRRVIIDFVDTDGNTTLSHYATISQDSKKIRLDRLRSSKCVIKIDNGDNAPLKNLSFKFKTDHKVLILANAASEMKIYFSGNAEKKVYDLEKYAYSVPLGKEVFELGKVEKSPFYAPSLPVEKIKSAVMWAVICIAGVILLIVIIKLLNSPTQPTEFEEK